MASLRTAVLATAMLSAGLLSSTGLATAAEVPAHGHSVGTDTDSQDGGKTVQSGLVNSNGFKPNTNPDACNNDVPANVGGVQVPLQDVAGTAPVLSKTPDGADPGIGKGCSNPAAG